MSKSIQTANYAQMHPKQSTEGGIVARPGTRSVHYQAFISVALLFTDDRRDGLQLVIWLQIDEFDALGIAAGLADVFHEGAHHLPTDGDEHDFVFVLYRQRANNGAGLLCGLHRNDAFAATRLLAVFLKAGPLADPVFAGDKQRRFRIEY